MFMRDILLHYHAQPIYLFLVYVYECFVHVSAEASRRCQDVKIPWSWSYSREPPCRGWNSTLILPFDLGLGFLKQCFSVPVLVVLELTV